jgi:hypothetical protein
LEREADLMGGKALSQGFGMRVADKRQGLNPNSPITQCAFWSEGDNNVRQWHAEDVDENWIDSGREHNENGNSGNIYFPNASLRGKMQGAADGLQGVTDHLLLACWNWALTGFQGDNVFPQHVFGYVQKKRLQLERPETVAFNSVEWINAEVPPDQGRQWLLHNYETLDQIMSQWISDLGEGEMPDDASRRATTDITRKIIEAHGFEISESKTPYQICMHYKKADIITFDHWWVKVDEKTVETFPGTRDANGIITSGVLDIQIAYDEQNHEGKEVIRFYVTALKPVQQGIIINAINAAM